MGSGLCHSLDLSDGVGDNRPLLPELTERVAVIAQDRLSGSAELGRPSRARPGPGTAARLRPRDRREPSCRAQPSMASIWNAAICAIDSLTAAEAWDRAVRRWARADRALDAHGSPTRSPSTMRRRACGHVLDERVRRSSAESTCGSEPSAMRVSCSEGRPALEGRTLAASLHADGIAVDFFTDAALSAALGGR